jgi:hypothetical protein
MVCQAYYLRGSGNAPRRKSDAPLRPEKEIDEWERVYMRINVLKLLFGAQLGTVVCIVNLEGGRIPRSVSGANTSERLLINAHA